MTVTEVMVLIVNIIGSSKGRSLKVIGPKRSEARDKGRVAWHKEVLID